MSIIQTMDHFTIVTADLPATRDFYQGLGLVSGPRPDFPVPGLWLYANGKALLHVIEVREADMPTPRRGVLDHMAFWGKDLIGTVEWIGSRGIAHRLVRAPKPFRTWQLFFLDPNGVEVEIDFDPSEPAPAR
ncbi:VOC family protein [Azospirillum sp. INR13]|uniref:VOC family protein n=1 Tax=Azospirillum sp. INR13 TaxID=2596919 RepID=UPI0019D66988|nr:VOC family protein [Azospirillum sp. INR13]